MDSKQLKIPTPEEIQKKLDEYKEAIGSIVSFVLLIASLLLL